MIETLIQSVLYLVILWPLLLALPVLQKRVRRPLYLALLPAAVLVMLPFEISLSLPSVLMGSGLALDHSKRWILLASLLCWWLVMRFEGNSQLPADNTRNNLLLLTLSGNLGAILSIELVGFFSFSTLMGYAYFGLLLEDGKNHASRFAKRYLILLIIADLLLFEALLLAAFTTQNLQFGMVQQVMAKAAPADFYLALVLCGFALKAGLWPARLWLLSQYQSPLPANRFLVIVVPFSITMLGVMRWTPLGELAFAQTGQLLQIAGGVTLLTALYRLYSPFNLPRVTGWIAVAIGSLLTVALGSALSDPAFWREYAASAAQLIAISVTGLSLLVLSGASAQAPTSDATILAPAVAAGLKPLPRFNTKIIPLLRKRFGELTSAGLKFLAQRLVHPVRLWQSIDQIQIFNGWSSSMLLLVLIGLGFSWLAMSSN